ncbi:MAG: nitrilase family protein [Flavobacteriaceae bacterium]
MLKQNQLHIALLQSPLIWENPEQNRNVFAQKIAGLDPKTDLIILPEMFTTGFTMQPQHIHAVAGEKTIAWMQQMAVEKNVALLGSIPFFENEAYTNRLFFVHQDGSYQYYDKRHTFTLAGEDKVYRAGTEKLIVDYKGFKICPLICYDLRFPVWSRNIENYDVLIYVANWPKPRITAWDALLKARAIENMAYSIGVNRVGNDNAGNEYPGHSAVYDCLGERKVFSKEETILYTTLSKSHLAAIRNKLKFLDDRDEFNWSS